MKKVISAILCLSMIFSLMAPAFAYCDSIEENESKPFSYTTKEIFVPIIDDDGIVHEIAVTVCVPNGIDISAYGVYPDPNYKVGDITSFSFRIDNAQIQAITDIPGKAGMIVERFAKKGIAEIAATVVGESLAGPLVSGLLLAPAILDVIVDVLLIYGINGFDITVNMVYTEHYIHSGRYYMYGWALDSVKIKTY